MDGEYNVSEIESHDNATVHGLVVELSPVKESRTNPDCKYFNAKISDGKRVARFISFHPQLRQPMDKYRQESKSIALSACRIQTNKFDSKLEIMAGKRSTVQSSPKKFKIDDSILDDASSSKVEVVTIEEVMNLAINQCVTVVGKVVRVDAAMEVNSKESKVLMKQDCILSDSNGSCRVVLWQGDIGKLKEGQCYRMCRVSVKRLLTDTTKGMESTIW